MARNKQYHCEKKRKEKLCARTKNSNSGGDHPISDQCRNRRRWNQKQSRLNVHKLSHSSFNPCRKRKSHCCNDNTDQGNHVAEIDIRCGSITVETNGNFSSTGVMANNHTHRGRNGSNVMFNQSTTSRPTRTQAKGSAFDRAKKATSSATYTKGFKHNEDSGFFRGKVHRNLYNPSNNISTKDAQNEATAGEEIEIPGFYYDREKKRYFRIVAGQSNVMSSVITRDVLKSQKVEQQRQRDLLIQKKDGRKSLRALENICNVLRSRESGSGQCFAGGRFSRTLANGLQPRGSVKIFQSDTELPSYNALQHMTSMQQNDTDDSMLCLWSLKHIIGHRIQMLQLRGFRRVSHDAGSVDVHVCGPAVRSLSQITAICWASYATLPHAVLYTAMRHMGGGPSVALLRSLDGTDQRDYVVDEFSLGRGATWACAWDAQHMRFCVGMERHAVLVDVHTRRLWELHTHDSDAIAHVFSRDTGNTLYSGTRSGLICGHDLRSISTRSILQLSHSTSVCHLHLMCNETYLLASDFSGKINMWDLRKRAVVQEFIGHNEYSRIPFCLDRNENILCSAGQDCYTRLWCVHSGSLLQKLPLPYPASRQSIPSVCFLPDIQSTSSHPGLMMGIRDELHFYSL